MKRIALLIALLFAVRTLYAQEATSVQISISAINVSASIVETPLNASHTSWDVTALGMNVGHLQGTAWIDTPGNIALAGHVTLADGSPGVFAELEDLEAGDTISLTLSDGTERVYSVTDVFVVTPRDTRSLYPTDDDRLTLITCHNFDTSESRYRERLIVQAVRVE